MASIVSVEKVKLYPKAILVAFVATPCLLQCLLAWYILVVLEQTLVARWQQAPRKCASVKF